MFRSMLATTVCAILLSAVPAAAQTRGRSTQPPATPPAPAAEKPAPPPTAAPPVRAPERELPLQNVRVEITLTDQRGGTPPLKKTITVVAADGLLNRVRSSAQFSGQAGDVPLNLDLTPRVSPGGKIRLSLTLEYALPAPGSNTDPTAPPPSPTAPRLYRTSTSGILNTVLDDGKPLVIAQSADAISDRQVTIEVKATVLK